MKSSFSALKLPVKYQGKLQWNIVGTLVEQHFLIYIFAVTQKQMGSYGIHAIALVCHFFPFPVHISISCAFNAF